MARLPDKNSLSGPASLRSGRMISSADMSGIGQGLRSLGGSLAGIGADFARDEEEKRREGVVLDGATADGGSIVKLNDFERTFDTATDYDQFPARINSGLEKIRKEQAALIRDPKARQVWEAEFQKMSASTRDRIIGLGQSRVKETRLLDAKKSLEGFQTVIADDAADEEARAGAKRSADVWISGLQESGQLTPVEAEEWRDKVIRGGEFILGERMIAKDGAAAVSGALPANLKDRASTAMSFFQGRGYTKEQAAGIVGNLIAESKLAPSGAVGDNGTAFGIAQWRGERLTRLKRYAASQGKDWQDYGTQLAFVDMELQSHETGAYKALKNAKTVDEATAAFIGYERPAGWSTGNPRGGHNYGGRLKFAAQAAGENVPPDWYTNQPADKRLALDEQAGKRQAQMDTDTLAAYKAGQAAAKDEVALRIASFDPTLTRDSIMSNPNLDTGDRASLLNSYNEKMKDFQQTGLAVQQFASGGLRVDPYDIEGKKAVDNVYDAVTKASPGSLQSTTEELVRQTGIVPKQAMSLLRQGLSSMDVNAVMQAAQVASRLSAINPAAIARREGGAEVQKMADDFGFYVNNLNLPPEEAARRLQEMQDPAKMRDRKALEPAAKEFVKSLSTVDIAAEFDDSILGMGANPDLGFTPAQSIGLQAEFMAIAESEFFRKNGDPALAKNSALQEMKRLYGPTELTGKSVVMRHPPERYWPAFKVGLYGETHDYAKIQLKHDLGQLYPNVDMNRVQLVSTPETDAMVKRGEMPGYSVLYTDDNGVMQTIPGQLWRPDVSEQSRFKAERDAAEAAAAEEAARAARPALEENARQMLKGRDRDQTLDNFLDANPLTGGN